MKKSQKLIGYLNVPDYIVLAELLSGSSQVTADIIHRARGEKYLQFPNAGKFKDDAYYKSVSGFVKLGFIKKANSKTHTLEVVHDSGALEIVQLIEDSEFIGLKLHENTIINQALKFLLDFSPDNNLVSGEGGKLYEFFHNTRAKRHNTGMLGFEWLEIHLTGNRGCSYKLADWFVPVVNNWMAIDAIVRGAEKKQGGI